MKQISALEWLYEQIEIDSDLFHVMALIRQAKKMENNRATEYAEFCIRCDRAGLPLVQFEDWINGLTFKSE